MKRRYKLGIILILVTALAAVRGFSEVLFYDPLIDFFKYEYLYNDLPNIEMRSLIFNVFLRYLINSIISLLIIYVVYLKKEWFVFSLWVYIVCFFVFLIPFYLMIVNYEQENYLLVFYVRRFLIQPILLLLLLPAFYYHKLTDN